MTHVSNELNAALRAAYGRVMAVGPVAAPTLRGQIQQNTNGVQVLGIDPVQGSIMGYSPGANNLCQTDDDGADWGYAKGMPSGVAAAGVTKIVRFAGSLYAVGMDASDSNKFKVYRATPNDAQTAWTWSASLLTFATGSTHKSTGLTAGSQYIFAGEYGDPAGGPSIYRSADGTTWTTVYTDAKARHVHGIAEDPYNPGTIYATLGDGASDTVLIRSTDHGATWTSIVPNTGHWQCVQISFSPRWVFLAGDQLGLTVAVFDRATGQIYSAAPNWHAHMPPVPLAAVGDQFYNGAYFGAVDPTTGIYYGVANDTSTPGNTSGLFYLPDVGQRLELLESGAPGVPGEVFIWHGKLYTGNCYRPLANRLALTAPTPSRTVSFTVPITAGGDDFGYGMSGSVGVAFDAAAVTEAVGDYSSGLAGAGVGLIFRGLQLPPGSTVSAASVRVVSHSLDGAAPRAITVNAQAAPNPTVPTGNADAAGRARTAASATWTPAAWAASHTQVSVDISAVVQEVVNSASWKSHSDLLLFLDDGTGAGWSGTQGYMKIRTYDWAASAAPVLSVTATLPAL